MKRTGLFVAGFFFAATCVRAQTAPTETPAPPPPGWEALLKSVTDACKGETPALCPGLSAETALACLQGNFDKLSPGCKDSVMKAAKSALNL